MAPITVALIRRADRSQVRSMGMRWVIALLVLLGLACGDDHRRVDHFDHAIVESRRAGSGEVIATVRDDHGAQLAVIRWTEDGVVAKTAQPPDADLLPDEPPDSLAEASQVAYRLWLDTAHL
jgi:hypothetical protein